MPTVAAINTETFDAIDKHLAKMSAINRTAAVHFGLRQAAKIVRDRLRSTLPQPGYPGDKKGFKPLRDTLAIKIIDYPSGRVLAMVGYAYPAGSHGHLIELGHDIVVGGSLKRSRGQKKSKNASRSGAGRIVGSVKGFFYLVGASRITEPAQMAAVEAGIKKSLKQ